MCVYKQTCSMTYLNNEYAGCVCAHKINKYVV